MSEKKLDPKLEAALDAAELAGQTKAYTRVAGRCTSAAAMALATVHERKGYRILNLDWERYCVERVGISRKLADEHIRNLKEFGPVYFDLAQLTQINAQQYRQIAPSINEQGLTHAGETIAFTERNAPRLTAAIAEIRKGAESASKQMIEAGAGDAVIPEVARAERALKEAVKRCMPLQSMPLSGAMRTRVQASMDAAIVRLKDVLYAIL